ncbi:glucose-6-phosphate isomerase [Actibacterium sp. 188UL27-1]|uniref:glucose-6-phosphate isomerase n=1 Tax=Actibacterium sp. 188UL27-1 TaxID=2786961 RepID=UPI0019566509|nr:glucose-6-phosphate isomerase [Actibacterium sp. 188UL27-1]MBM7069661.1 glucose-6-phosphate isomerase [Actibacterium sp. 188UL27-1]
MWDQIREHYKSVRGRSMAGLFDVSKRPERFSVTFGDLLFDFSKTNLDTEGLWLLFQLVEQYKLTEKRARMFRGDPINETEGRAVLHTALRNLDGGPVHVDGEDVMPNVRETLARMGDFAESVRDGSFKGAGGQITDVVNIGIGGSDLGPAMATLALSPYHDGPRCHFVSNVDPAHICDTLRGLDPTTTLVIVASKTFTTIETMTNAATARAWVGEAVNEPSAQFVALSSAAEKTADFGIPPERVFGFEDWVGGRYSLWGPIGLSLMIAIGREAFHAFLRGAQSMDNHFRAADARDSMPVLLALVGIWHHQICGYPTRAVLPYDQRLSRLPAYLQQLEMESNGKSVVMDGSPLGCAAGPIVWGEPGTNGQHAFYQLIHQGKAVVPCEFMVAARGHDPDLAHQHNLLIANCLAQSEALMKGRSRKEALDLVRGKGVAEDDEARQASHRVFPGNRPSTTLIYPKLTPDVLGQIIALYEHRVFVEGVLLGINSFDQWGVELGKELATALGPIVDGSKDAPSQDTSTGVLVNYVHRHGVR